MSEANDSQSKPLRVLIADDQKEARQSTELMMSLIPDVEVVAVAHNGRQAVQLTRRHQPDIALMDIRMPQMNGLEAIQQMITYQPHLVCIVLSAERDDATFRRALQLGIGGYLIKPFTSEELVAVMQRARQRVMSNRFQVQQLRQEAEEREKRLLNENKAYLEELANEYVKTRRTDDKAMRVYEVLVRDPDCEPRWIMALTIVYVARKEWGKLKTLAARLEKQGQQVA